jgi:hypothetical protein
MAHGWHTTIYLTDANHNHGADAFCEAVCLAVEKVWEMSMTSRRLFPQHLVLQSDNAVAQAKNECVFHLLAHFVARYKFITANIFFLMVGHSHEAGGDKVMRLVR